MAPGYLKDCHIVALNGTSFRESYKPQNLKMWIEAGGGHVSFKEKLTEQTTHVVIDEDTWLDQGPFVQEILKAEVKDTPEEKGRAIHIVSFEWLDVCFDARAKKSEKKYWWKKKSPGVLKDGYRSSKEQDREEKEPGNTQGLMQQAFLESTNNFVDVGEKRRIEKRKRQEALNREEDLEEEQRQFEIHRKKMSVPEQAAVFRKGAKRARNDILSDNHHIYVDSTGFTYDITITKVDLNNNANERYVLTLQIYESNTQPYTYAFNCSFGGTKVLSRNDIISVIGSNFRTTFRAFKKVFAEKTKVQWDDRILEFNQREANAALNAGKEEPAFNDQPFEYYPPKYGPVGELPLAQVEAMEAAAAQAAEAHVGFRPSPVVDGWRMGGGNGSPGFDEFMESSAKDNGFPPGDELNESPFAYPFPGNAEDDAIVVDDEEEEDDDPQAASDEHLTEGMDGEEQEVPDTSTGPIINDQEASTNVNSATEEPSNQKPTESYDFPEMVDEVFKDPTLEAYTAETQAAGKTQLADAVRSELLSEEQQQQLLIGDLGEPGVTVSFDDRGSETSTVVDEDEDEDGPKKIGVAYKQGDHVFVSKGGGNVDLDVDLI